MRFRTVSGSEWTVDGDSVVRVEEDGSRTAYALRRPPELLATYRGYRYRFHTAATATTLADTVTTGIITADFKPPVPT